MAAPKKTRSKVGVIGLGIIGTRVAANLRSAGHQVYVWSRTPRAAPNFLGSVVEVADLCDVIQLFVSDDGALQEVTRTVAAALSHRHVVLCHATVSPEATRQAAGIVESQGARYLDAPFTGSKMAAQNRQLVYYIGGAKAALEEARPVLEATSKAILHVGGVGDAAVLKIATNLLTASTVQTLAEALALVRAAGIDGSKLVEALENNASRSGTSDLKLPAMIAANTEPNFSLKHMLKDVRFAQALADKYELSLPVTDITADVLELGMQNDWGDQDFSVVAQLYPAPAPATPPAPPAPTPPSAAEAVPTPFEKPTVEAPAEKSAPVETPKVAAPSVKPALAEEPRAADKHVSAEAPSSATDKPATEEVKTSADSPVELELPPRPGTGTKPNFTEATKSDDKPSKDAPADQSAKASPPKSSEKDDKAPSADAAKKSDAAAASPVAEAAKKPDASPSDSAKPAADAVKREKKSTLQFIRGFFKPVTTEKN